MVYNVVYFIISGILDIMKYKGNFYIINEEISFRWLCYINKYLEIW